MINQKLNDIRNSKLIKYSEHEEFEEICGNHHTLIHTINNKNPSILELFNYNNLYKNKDLNHKLEDIEFSVNDFNTLGILYKCSEVESNVWNKWSEIHIKNKNLENNSYRSIIFDTYLAYYLLAKIVETVEEITMEDNSLNKAKVITEICRYSYPDENIETKLYDHSLNSLKHCLHDTHTYIRNEISNRTSPRIIYDSPKLLGQSLNTLDKMCNIINDHLFQEIPMRYFLMFDKIDNMKNWQKKGVNDLILRTNAPISVKITSNNDYMRQTSDATRSLGAMDLARVEF